MTKNIKRSLDARESRFVGEYLIDVDPKRAAIAAGYSKSMAATKAYQWVSNGKVKPHVFEAVQEAMKARSDRTEVTADRVLAEFAKLAFLDPRRFYDGNGALKPVHLLDADVAAALVGVDVVDSYDKESQATTTTKKIKFADKKGALDSCARHLGMFIDKMELGGKGGGPLETVTRIELVPMRGNSTN